MADPSETATPSTTQRLAARAREVLRPRDGPLTRDLVQRPAAFGLGRLPERLLPDAVTTSVCGFCSTGCGLSIHVRGGRAINVTPDPHYPVNLGMACPKGWESLTPLAAADRAHMPYARGANGALEPVYWDRALDLFCERFKEIQRRHGPDSLAFLGTGQITTEEMALLGSLAKFGMGIRHGDGNTRQCMATSAVAYKEAFGFDAPPFTYADFEQSDVLVFVGANPCIAHPIMWQRVLANRHDPAIVVLDPRRTETAAAATHHVALRPASDLVVLYGVARVLIERDLVDHGFVARHTECFEQFAEHVEAFTPAAVYEASGVEPARLDELATLVGTGERVSLWWTMGVNQGHEAVRTAQAIINLALMTGNVGRPGTGANSITGQTNAMGSRLFSNTASLLGGRDFGDAGHRREVAETLAIDEGAIPRDAGWTYERILDGVRAGIVKGLWIIATNPAHSWIDRARLDEELFDRLEFLVVQDLYHTTETARRADLVLPAAGIGEKEGTVINSERRIGLVKNLSPTPGQAMADFWILKAIAERWGCGDLFERWTSPEATFEILKELSRGRPCDFSGIDGYEALDRSGGIQWPCAEGSAGTAIERRLFEDGSFFRPGGRARFCFEAPRPLPEAPDEDYPLVLVTGRGSSAQWHTNTRTAKSAVLRTLYPETAYVEIAPGDASRLAIADGDRVEIASRRGTVRVRAHVTECVAAGQVFMAMHYDETNLLTHPSFDPYSRQPAYKACAVRVTPVRSRGS